MSFLPKRLTVAAAITTIGALAIPAASGAAVTPVVDGTVLTVTSNQDADTIAIADRGWSAHGERNGHGPRGERAGRDPRHRRRRQ